MPDFDGEYTGLEFELTQKHLDLMAEGYYHYHNPYNFGSVGLESKRPFGNSNVYGDMGKILGIEPEKEMTPMFSDRPWFDFSDRQKAEMNYFFRTELPVAMRIVLSNQSFNLGMYIRQHKFDNDWKFAD